MSKPLAPDPTACVIVLAGGAARRFGSDKLAAPLAGSTVLDHLLARLPAQWPVIAVGEPRETVRVVTWTSENPAGGGPLAAVAAGARLATAEIVVVVAGDMPWAGGALRPLVDALGAGLSEGGGQAQRLSAAIARDDQGQVNPLLAAYRRLDLLAHLPEPAHDRPAKILLGLPHLEVPVAGPAARDVDTPADLVEILASPPVD